MLLSTSESYIPLDRHPFGREYDNPLVPIFLVGHPDNTSANAQKMCQIIPEMIEIFSSREDAACVLRLIYVCVARDDPNLCEIYFELSCPQGVFISGAYIENTNAARRLHAICNTMVLSHNIQPTVCHLPFDGGIMKERLREICNRRKLAPKARAS